MQHCSITSALAMEIRQSCTKPSMCLSWLANPVIIYLINRLIFCLIVLCRQCPRSLLLELPMALYWCLVSRQHNNALLEFPLNSFRPGPIFCVLFGVSSDYAQPITGQVTEVTCPVIGRAQPELTPSKRQKTGPCDTYRHQRPRSPYWFT